MAQRIKIFSKIPPFGTIICYNKRNRKYINVEKELITMKMRKKIIMMLFVMIILFTVKLDVNAEVVRNLTGEKDAWGWVYDYKYWNGSSWTYCADEKYTNYPIDITYDVTYCYEEAYKMIDLVNAERRKAGVPELQAKDELMDVAMMRAAETAIYWSHTRPDGSSFCSASIYSDGENLHMYTIEDESADNANESLVKSPGHYAQMIDSSYAYAGYGCVRVNGNSYWVQIFSHPDIYYENGYDRLHPESNKPVLWEKMQCGERKDYTAKFTVKINPKFISLQIMADDKELYVGEETGGKIYTYYYYELKNLSFLVNLSSDQYDVKVLTPDLCSYDNGKITALKAGTAKIQYTLKADNSLTSTLEIKIKDMPVKNKVIVGNNKYKVTNTSKRTVSFWNSEKDAASVSIPDIIKIQGKTYKVTSIAANAFKDDRQLTSVAVGKNVTAVGKNAFYGCSKLKKLTVKSTKLNVVGKNALKGIHAKAVIKVPKNKLAKYKKLFKGKGQKKTVKIKR